MIPAHQPSDPAAHALAIRLARECRAVVQACLLESEWRECDHQFFLIIRAGLEAPPKERAS